MDKSQHSIGDLLERRHDDEALAELAQKKGDASRLAAGKLRRLKPGLSVDAGWLCRVLGRVSADPLGILLPVLAGTDYPKYRNFAIAAHCWARPEDSARILAALKKLVPTAFTSSGKCELPATLNQYSGMTGVTILLETLARLDPASIRAPARALFATARNLLPRSAKSRSFEAQSRKVDFFPLLAASAAALLANANVEGSPANRDTETWESACVRAALDPAMSPATCSFGPPLSFLFVGSPDIAGRLITRLINEAEDPARILTQIGVALEESRKMGFPITINMPAVTGNLAEQKLDVMVEQAAQWGVFANIPAWAAMEFRRNQNPRTVEKDALRLFRDAMIETSLIDDAMDQLGDAVSAATFPAIAVETILAKRSSERSFASVQEKDEQQLNAQLKRARMKQFKGLSWIAPSGKKQQMNEIDNLQALEETLRAVHEAIHTAAQTPNASKAETDSTAAFIRNLFPHTLCRHAIYRNLACELCNLPEEQYARLLALLPDLEMERDAGMIKMIAKWSDQADPEPFNALLARFLDHQLVKSDMELLERVVSRLARAPKPEFHMPLKALKQHLAEAVAKDAPNFYSAAQAIDELLLALGSDDSIIDVSKKVAGNKPVSTEEKMTMLRLAADGSIALEQGLFEKLFSEAIESEHMTWTGWTAVITGRQVREYIMKTLSDKSSPHARVIAVARYCFWARKDGIPAPALVPILERLSPAIELAKTSPGETWEDRNWGGYTTSGSEDLADALSLAVKGFVESDCKAIDWHDLISELTRLTTIDLSKIPLGESSSCGFSFSNMNLLTRLESKFKRLKDPDLANAVAALRKKPSRK